MNQITLPPAWDYQLDLCILIGRGSEELAQHMLDQGQKRLFVVTPEQMHGLPEGAIHVPSPSELLFPIVAARGAAPGQVVVHPTNDPWATSAVRDAVVKATREAVHSRQAQHLTLDRNGATWLVQGLANVPSLARFPAVTSLYDKFAGRTAFVCAPGPSLSEAIPHLKANREACLIIAVSHAVQSLVDSGVSPDIIIVADPGSLDRHFKGVDTSDVGALVVASTCRVSLFDFPAQTYFHFAGNGRIDDWLYAPIDVDARLASGGSVTCSAASLALKIGCRRVVFCGLDLSFPGGRYYAQESLDGDARVVEEDGKFFLRKEAGADGSSYRLPDGSLRFSADQSVATIPSANGGSVSTSISMRIFLSWFEALAQETRGQAELVQTSRDGAYIEGFVHNSIADEAMLANFTGESFESIAREVTRAHDVIETTQRLRAHFEVVSDALPPLTQLARKLAGLSARAAKDPALLKKLQAGEKQLRGALGPLTLLTVAAHGDLQRAEGQARAGTTLEQNMCATRRIFLAIERAARLVQPCLTQALVDLEAISRPLASDAAA